ncbi:nucleotide sugar dehydrogenase [Paenibacillaceae bacterium]|nr:nucleotide sugar dehydrogenase [Paenibacillaceae bacterium]
MELYQRLRDRQAKLAVIGLGYVGLPLAVAFSRVLDVIGYDVNRHKISQYQNGIDPTGDTGDDAVKHSAITFTDDAAELRAASCFIIGVPTPVQADKVPDLQYVRQASITVGQSLQRGVLVVYESTVYPGVTEEVCLPILEEQSGLKCGTDFTIAYSPERINPGDRVHRLENITKIVSGIDKETLDEVAAIYELIIEAGVYRADSIRVAEAAKVIENAQRDINIAFMNELSMLFNNMGIDTQAVLRAAGTKWNFLNFRPGLVGGHCIGIDPYYLTYKAEGAGYHSKIILAGRHINDGMGQYIAQQIIKHLVRQKEDLSDVRIGCLGLAYKENCSDVRNTKVIDIVSELAEYGVTTFVADYWVNKAQVQEEYGIELVERSDLRDLNVLVVAVPHDEYRKLNVADFDQLYAPNHKKLMFDVTGIYNKTDFENNGYYYWSL